MGVALLLNRQIVIWQIMNLTTGIKHLKSNFGDFSRPTFNFRS